MQLKDSLPKALTLLALMALVAFGQNCGRVEFTSTEVPVGKAANEGEASVPDDADEAPVAEDDSESPKEWLTANCDPEKLKKAPACVDYITTAQAVEHQQKQLQELNISGAGSVRLHQLDVGKLTIAKAGTVEIHQIKAGSVSIEALNVQKLQQLSVKELFLRTKIISKGNLQQIGLNGGKLHVEADVVDGNVQQLSALCLSTSSAQAIQQIEYGQIVGRNLKSKRAQIGRIQQMREVVVEDADVENIQQIDQVTLRNVRVKELSQVGKLILINSSVEKMSQVGEVVKQ